LIPEGEMRQMLAAAGVETDPAAVGIDKEYHRQTLMGARLIRRRYTVLDLLEDAGLLDDAVAHLYSGTQG
jgi:glycerol-1-phosphate dehydrogenase [NAD(P)+]